METVIDILENELKNREYYIHKNYTGSYAMQKNEEYYYNLGKLSMLKACIFTIKHAEKYNKK